MIYLESESRNLVLFYSYFPESDDSSESGEEAPTPTSWISVIGEDAGPDPVPFTAHPGPKHPPPSSASPVEYFNLFMTDGLVSRIVTETNTFASQFIQANQQYLQDKPRSRVHYWIRQGGTTAEEFRAFLGVAVNMGLIKKSCQADYWDTINPSQFTPWFVEHFSRNRFQLMMKFLHFANNEDMPAKDDPAYRLFKVQSLVDHFQTNFRRHYHPQQNVSVDESMVGYKGKTPHLREFEPNKRHARFGIKLWMLSDATNGYAYNFEPAKGAPSQQDRLCPQGVTYSLVMRLLRESDLLSRGHHVGMDNYFTSPALLDELYAHQTTATGTVRVNRKGLPKLALRRRLTNQQTVDFRRGQLLCTAFQDGKRRPILLTTAVPAGFATKRTRRGQNVRKPKVVLNYNKTMGGVDLGDARLYPYLAERRTMKWTLKFAFNLFGRALLNAYIIYEANTRDRPKMKRHLFTVKIVESLAGHYHPPKVTRKRRSKAEIAAAREEAQIAVAGPSTGPSPGPSAGPSPGPSPGPSARPSTATLGEGHELAKLPPKKKRNCVASKHSNRVRSGWICRACDVGLCPECFAEYHKRPRY